MGPNCAATSSPIQVPDRVPMMSPILCRHRTREVGVGEDFCACMHVCTDFCACMHVWTDFCACMHMWTYFCACMHVWTDFCVCMHVWIDLCVHACVDRLLCVHAHTTVCLVEGNDGRWVEAPALIGGLRRNAKAEGHVRHGVDHDTRVCRGVLGDTA